MKRWILSAAVMLLLAGGVQAQTTEKKATNKTTHSTHKAKAKKSTQKGARPKPVKVTSDSLNDRRIYNADNGQRATPTGHEATGTGSGYSSIKKDTAVVVPKGTKKGNKNKTP